MTELNCIQAWSKDREVWYTLHLTTDDVDCESLYWSMVELADRVGTDLGLRFVTFTVDNLDFIAAQARDFKVHNRRSGASCAEA